MSCLFTSLCQGRCLCQLHAATPALAPYPHHGQRPPHPAQAPRAPTLPSEPSRPQLPLRAAGDLQGHQGPQLSPLLGRLSDRARKAQASARPQVASPPGQGPTTLQHTSTVCSCQAGEGSPLAASKWVLKGLFPALSDSAAAACPQLCCPPAYPSLRWDGFLWGHFHHRPPREP